jgi:hypothetical protein
VEFIPRVMPLKSHRDKPLIRVVHAWNKFHATGKLASENPILRAVAVTSLITGMDLDLDLNLATAPKKASGGHLLCKGLGAVGVVGLRRGHAW